MAGEKLKRKKLQERTLRNEMLSIGSKFHTKAMQWLNETRELYTEDSAELQNHPNSILSELKCINHERTYIAYKITALAKDKMLSPPQKLRRKLRKLEMEVKFQEEFPDEYKKFMKNMKQRLHQKPYSLNKRRKNTNGNLKNTVYKLSAMTLVRGKNSFTEKERATPKKKIFKSAKSDGWKSRVRF